MPICPVCASSAVKPFLDLGQVPVFCNVQWPTRTAAEQAKKAGLSLSACGHCGHIFNALYDPDVMAYSPGYDNTQHFSSTFRDYAQRLVERLVGTYDVRNQSVVDIGCGRGDLLQLLCAHGKNRGFGFDPSFAGAAAEEATDVTISREYFTRKHGAEIAPALVCCRHVLEHVPSPIEFLVTIREAISARGSPVLYLEVPNGEQLLRDSAVWDYIYEHVSYFSRRSLELSLKKAGLEILALYEDFGGQFLCADVRSAANTAAAASSTVASTDLDIENAALRMNQKLRHWRAWADSLRTSGGRATIWGAGSKGVMFLNLVNAQAPAPIEFAVDQNPNKHGQFIAGTAQQVTGPETIVTSGVQHVVLMNSIYREEISKRLNSLGARADVLIA